MRRGEQPPWIVSDDLWTRIEPMLPVSKRNWRHPGRKRLDNRKVLQGILFVLYTGIQWEFLPQELGFGSGMTCWRRLEEWNRAGVWARLHALLLAELQAVPPVRGRRGRPRCRPVRVYADRGYDHDKYRKAVRAKGIRPHIARRGQAHGSGLGVFRWVVERTIAWLHGMNGSASAGNAATTCTRPSLAWPPASSLIVTCNDSVRTSYEVAATNRRGRPAHRRPGLVGASRRYAGRRPWGRIRSARRRRHE